MRVPHCFRTSIVMAVLEIKEGGQREYVLEAARALLQSDLPRGLLAQLIKNFRKFL